MILTVSVVAPLLGSVLSTPVWCRTAAGAEVGQVPGVGGGRVLGLVPVGIVDHSVIAVVVLTAGAAFEDDCVSLVVVLLGLATDAARGDGDQSQDRKQMLVHGRSPKSCISVTL